MPIVKVKEKRIVLEMRKKGLQIKHIAGALGITRQRVWQILKELSTTS